MPIRYLFLTDAVYTRITLEAAVGPLLEKAGMDCPSTMGGMLEGVPVYDADANRASYLFVLLT